MAQQSLQIDAFREFSPSARKDGNRSGVDRRSGVRWPQDAPQELNTSRISLDPPHTRQASEGDIHERCANAGRAEGRMQTGIAPRPDQAGATNITYRSMARLDVRGQSSAPPGDTTCIPACGTDDILRITKENVHFYPEPQWLIPPHTLPSQHRHTVSVLYCS